MKPLKIASNVVINGLQIMLEPLHSFLSTIHDEPSKV